MCLHNSNNTKTVSLIRQNLYNIYKLENNILWKNEITKFKLFFKNIIILLKNIKSRDNFKYLINQ